MTNIFSTANEIVGKLKTGDISCVDLCKAYIDRIEKFEKDVCKFRAISIAKK